MLLERIEMHKLMEKSNFRIKTSHYLGEYGSACFDFSANFASMKD